MCREGEAVDTSIIQQAMLVNIFIVAALVITGVGTWYAGTYGGYFLALLTGAFATFLLFVILGFDWLTLFSILWPFWSGLPILVYLVGLLKERWQRLIQREQSLLKEVEQRRRIERFWHQLLAQHQAYFWTYDLTTNEVHIQPVSPPSALTKLLRNLPTLPHDHPLASAYQQARTGQTVRTEIDIAGQTWVCTLEPDYQNSSPHRIFGLAIPQISTPSSDPAIEEEHQRLQTLISESPIIFFRREREDDGEWHLVYISPNVERLLGYSEEELLASDLQWALDITHPEDLPTGMAHVERLRKTGSSTMRVRLRHKKGHYIWVESYAQITRTVNGREVYQGYMLDITELATTQQQLEEQRTFYRTILEHMPDIVLVILADGTIVYASANAPHRLPGLKEQETPRIPAALTLALRPEDRHQVHHLLSVLPTCVAGEVYRAEWAIHDEEGNASFYEVEVRHLAETNSINGYILTLHDITERKALTNRLQLFSHAIEHGAHPMLILDAHLNIIYSNSAFQSLLGNTNPPETASGLTALEHLANTYHFNTSLSNIRDYVLAHGQWHGQLVGHHTNGDPLILDVGVSKFERDGQLWFVVIVQDITETHQMALQLQQANLFLEQLIEHSPIVMFRREGEDFRLTYISPNVERILGFPAKAVLGKPLDAINERVPPDEISRLHAHAQRVIEYGYDSILYRTYHRDGTVRWIYGVSRRFTDEHGTPFVIGYLQDVTEEEEARRALLKSEARYRHLVEQSGLVMCILDMEGRFLWVNRTFEEATGYTLDELSQITLYDLLKPASPSDIPQFLHMLQSNGYVEGIGRARHKDGSLRLFQYKTFLRVEDGEEYIYAYGHDITEQYTLRKARKRLETLQQTLWELGKKALAERTPETLYTFTVTTLARALGAPHVLLYLYDPKAEENIRIAASHGLDSEQHARLSTHTPLLQKVAHSLFLHTPQLVREETSGIFDEMPQHVAYYLPLVHDYTAYGLLLVVAHEDIFDENTVQFLHNAGTILVNALQRYAYEQKIATLAYTDPLTDLPNRRLFFEEGQRLLALAKRHQRSVALLYLDLDQFKEVNDTLSHEAGDLLLRETAQRLKEATRASDLIARLGGDEFAILLDDVGENEALRVAHRIQEALQEPIEILGHRIALSTSIGIAFFPTHGEDLNDLLRNADVAMYHAKRTRAFASVYRETFHAHTPDHLTLAADLRTAIQQRRIDVYFQPILDVQHGTIPKVEALARWFHPERGFISPGVFIPLAEQHGLIAELDRVVLEKAIQHLKEWHRQGFTHLHVAVNLSPQTIRNMQIAAFLKTLCGVYSLRPQALTIEITESILADYHTIKPILQHLHSLGVEIAIDDFGTGYSSLSYIENLPLDIIKADRAFVMSIGERSTSEAILSTILTLAKNLGVAALAEGVETTQQLHWLRQHQCRFVQGFLLSKPVPADDVLSTIAQLEENLGTLFPGNLYSED